MSADRDELSAEDAAVRALEPVFDELLRFGFLHSVSLPTMLRAFRRRGVAYAMEKCREADAPATPERLAAWADLPTFYVDEALDYFRTRGDRDRIEADLMGHLARLLTTWNSIAPFVAPQGLPLELKLDPTEQGVTFKGLLESAEVPLTQNQALDALKSASVVELLGDGKYVRCVQQELGYKNQRLRNIERYGLRVAAYASTLRFNMDRPSSECRFERHLFTDWSVPDELFSEFHDIVFATGDKWLRELNAEQRGYRAKPGVRARKYGIGVFLYEVPGSEVLGDLETEPETIDVLAPRRVAGANRAHGTD